MSTLVIIPGADRQMLSAAEQEPFLPRWLPANWETLPHPMGGVWYRHRSGLRVLASVVREEDGRRWLHVSLSHRTHLPSRDQVSMIKDLFIGDRYAYEVWPPASKYVNAHRYCLHLWSCVDAPDGKVLPDFTGGGNIL